MPSKGNIAQRIQSRLTDLPRSSRGSQILVIVVITGTVVVVRIPSVRAVADGLAAEAVVPVSV